MMILQKHSNINALFKDWLKNNIDITYRELSLLPFETHIGIYVLFFASINIGISVLSYNLFVYIIDDEENDYDLTIMCVHDYDKFKVKVIIDELNDNSIVDNYKKAFEYVATNLESYLTVF